MANITAGMVAELRAKTDAPMMECKKALTEAEGDMVKAEELLRVKLGSKASKASSRVTAEGVISIAMNGKSGAMLEVNCETDFVTKNDSFLALTNAAAQLIASHHPANIDELSALSYSQDGFGPTRDVAMHVAAMKPVSLTSADVPTELIERERSVATAKAAESGKPAEIASKMIDGAVQKYLKEVSLFNQPFVKNDKQTVEQMLQAAKTNVKAFTMYVVGEGIERKVDDFAAEVAAQVAAAKQTA